MHKILLVDDEILTRNAISQNIPWEDAGFQLIGTAENGKEAIGLIDQEPPDVVLTDICMPVMDGISLSAYIHEKYPATKVIIISGYDDFEYAKQALKYEVSNYILKPITSYELMAELTKVRSKIEYSQKRQSEFEQAQHEIKENLPTIRRHFLNRLLEGNYIKNDIELQMERLNIPFLGYYQAVVMLEAGDSTDFWKRYPTAKEELIDFSIANISEEMVANHPNIIFFMNTEHKTILVFGNRSEEGLISFLQETCQSIIGEVYRHMKIKVYTLVGKTVRNMKEWGISYQSVRTAKEHKFSREDQDFIYGSEFSEAKKEVQPLLTQQIDKLVLMIKMNQQLDIKSITNYIFASLRSSGKEKKQLMLIIQNLVLTILLSLESHLADMNKSSYEEEFLLQISTYQHLSDVEKWFFHFCEELSENIASMRDDVRQVQAAKAMDYLEKNYMDYNMSLNMICDHLGVSTSYFSSFFKSVTGETFTEALTRIRMKEAKHHFEKSNMKNYQVAYAVGYQDPHYFSSIFKKNTGMTPSEYAKQLRKGKDKP